MVFSFFQSVFPPAPPPLLLDAAPLVVLLSTSTYTTALYGVRRRRMLVPHKVTSGWQAVGLSSARETTYGRTLDRNLRMMYVLRGSTLVQIKGKCHKSLVLVHRST